MFTNQRLFTIKTEPGPKIVNRNRNDFKWLTKKLKEEFPNVFFHPIEKGDLSKKVIEDYFDNLLSLKNVFQSRFLRFFLSANDSKFKKKKHRDMNWLNKIAQNFAVDGDLEVKRQNLDEELEVMVGSELIIEKHGTRRAAESSDFFGRAQRGFSYKSQVI